MPGIHLHRSNRLEALADALAATLAEPPAAVFSPETVVVQSLGMRRWLQLELAQRRGVAMNVRFPFPAELSAEVLRAVLPEAGEGDAFSRDVLPWRMLALFPRLLGQPPFASLRGYIAGEMSALKEFQLAQKVAGVFDRYLAYRPELLTKWQRGNDDHWQAQLWRELVRGHADTNPPALAQRVLAQFRAGRIDAGRLPSRVSVFGISSLPPIYLELLQVLGTAAEVHLFLLEPTADYWADTPTLQELDRAARRVELHELPPDEEPEIPGNRLLSSLCKIGRDFSWLLLDRFEAVDDREYFTAPGETAMLGQLQADIFLQRQPAQPRPVAPGDCSLQVHCCHGPMRELEVLHDQLLDLFARNPQLTPRDVLVTMPDVETYAPFIDAVFGAPESEALRIPFTIADRAARAESSIAAALLQVLDLVGSRFPAPAVLALLDTPAIRARFDLAEADLARIRDWVEGSGIRWGIDEDHREALALPRFPENTWRAGLDRLLLGYALPGDGATLFAGVLPVPDIEGQFAFTLGRFVDFTDRLFARCADLAAARTPAAWEQALRALVADLFDASDDSADELRRVNAVFEQLAAHAAAGGFDAPLEFGVIRAQLAGALADDSASGGFLAGRVTFCALKPMRSIPFRVLCMLGLDGTAFPRRDRPLSFDLMPQRPQRGDRTMRDDDRYLFLESLFSARDTLYLSYCGLSIRDNAESPPSVVLAELLDYLGRTFALPADFVVRHRLQPFSAAYFSGENARLFSYSADHAAAAQRGTQTRQAAPAFAAAPLPAPDAEWREVSLHQLTDFLTKPARYFLNYRLRLRLPDGETPPAESEPSTLDGLTCHQLREALTARSLAHRSFRADLAAARATGALPPGYAGASDYGQMAREVERLLRRIGSALDDPPLDALPVFLPVGNWRLVGTLGDVRPTGLVRYRAAKCKAKDQLHAWLAHLALQLTGAPVRTTTWHALDSSFRFAPVPDAAAHLGALLDLYARGLSAPLPFFPEASLDFAERSIEGNGRLDPLVAARQTFEKVEAGDAWTQLAFRGIDDPLGGDFTALATQIWQPLFAAREDL